MPKRKGRGRPKVSGVQKRVKESADGELVFPDIPLKVLKTEPAFIEEQEGDTSMPKKKEPGQPTQNCQESDCSNLNSCSIPLNIGQVGPGCEESEDVVFPNKNGREQPRSSAGQCCPENADSNNIYSNPSNMMEAIRGCKEEQEHETGTAN
ncbi:hypothetical protein Fmac_004489 [Flemingia macrophylla]|uniref:Uncharacterized protein n=1 Tax=Flemingia macrophylla TaxID=520843 RepID=A0ABD1N522_9FABA